MGSARQARAEQTRARRDRAVRLRTVDRLTYEATHTIRLTIGEDHE